MSKQIAFLVKDQDQHGKILFATWREEVRAKWIAKALTESPDRILVQDEQIVDPELISRNALKFLDPLQQLALGVVKDPSPTRGDMQTMIEAVAVEKRTMSLPHNATNAPNGEYIVVAENAPEYKGMALFLQNYNGPGSYSWGSRLADALRVEQGRATTLAEWVSAPDNAHLAPKVCKLDAASPAGYTDA